MRPNLWCVECSICTPHSENLQVWDLDVVRLAMQTDYKDVVDWLRSKAQAQSPVLESARRAAADTPVVLATTLAPEMPSASSEFLSSTDGNTPGSSVATTAACEDRVFLRSTNARLLRRSE